MYSYFKNMGQGFQIFVQSLSRKNFCSLKFYSRNLFEIICENFDGNPNMGALSFKMEETDKLNKLTTNIRK